MYLRDWIEHVVFFLLLFVLQCVGCLLLIWFTLPYLMVAFFYWLPVVAPLLVNL